MFQSPFILIISSVSHLGQFLIFFLLKSWIIIVHFFAWLGVSSGMPGNVDFPYGYWTFLHAVNILEFWDTINLFGNNLILLGFALKLLKGTITWFLSMTCLPSHLRQNSSEYSSQCPMKYEVFLLWLWTDIIVGSFWAEKFFSPLILSGYFYFFHFLKMSLFHIHSWKILSLNIEFWIDTFIFVLFQHCRVPLSFDLHDIW